MDCGSKGPHGTLTSGLELHVKFVEEFLRDILVSLLITHLSILPLSQGWFNSLILEFGARYCTRNKSKGVQKVVIERALKSSLNSYILLMEGLQSENKDNTTSFLIRAACKRFYSIE